MMPGPTPTAAMGDMNFSQNDPLKQTKPQENASAAQVDELAVEGLTIGDGPLPHQQYPPPQLEHYHQSFVPQQQQYQQYQQQQYQQQQQQQHQQHQQQQQSWPHPPAPTVSNTTNTIPRTNTAPMTMTTIMATIGCKPNPKEAIVHLERAAAYAMSELKEFIPGSTANIQAIQQQRQQRQGQSSTNTDNLNVPGSGQSSSLRRMGSIDRRSAMMTARKELVMALYELGMSFLKGWGVQRDKVVAFNYFKLAADLGDPDSQNETAQCFLDGVGTEKNAFEAARYYRMASDQGASQFGNSWIWKPKYDQYCEQYAANAAAAKNTQEQNKPGTSSPSSSSSSSSTPSHLASLIKNMPARGHLHTQSLEQNQLSLTGAGAAGASGGRGGPPRQGRYNIAGDLISSSQLELKIKQAEQLTSTTVGPVLESPGATGKKKHHRWSLWGHNQHRRAPSTS
ncbi:hypothetical protein BGX26_005958 [Mortierella sp. AD094]|nr:hypothetical protein BGX26_005958 [Mortierella sp. AD094]